MFYIISALMGLTIQKLLTYFTPDELKDALFDINEPRSGTRKELEKRILDEWEEHNRTWTDLLTFIYDDDMLATICDDYNEKSDGVRSTLIRRIVKLLESSKPSIGNQPKSSPVSISMEGSTKIKEKIGNEEHHPKKRLIKIAVTTVVALVAITTLIVNSATIMNIIEGNNQNKTLVVMPNETQPTNHVAKIYLYDNTNDGRIMLNIDFFTPHQNYVTYDKILMLGALPADGVINVKLADQHYVQYNESMFTLSDMRMDEIKPIPVSSGKLNQTVPINLYPMYTSSENYLKMNDTQWYSVNVGNATFRFDYINTNNDNQSFFITQTLSVKVKGCPDHQNRPIPCT